MSPERCAIPPSLHLEMVKILDFFVSGQTCGQTKDLMIFRHSGEPKKSVFSRVFGSTRKLHAENGDGVPNVALYQAEPHLVIKLFFAPRALPVVTKTLSALLCNLPIVKSLPLLFVRFFRHRRRSQTSPS